MSQNNFYQNKIIELDKPKRISIPIDNSIRKRRMKREIIIIYLLSCKIINRLLEYHYDVDISRSASGTIYLSFLKGKIRISNHEITEVNYTYQIIIEKRSEIFQKMYEFINWFSNFEH